MRRKAWARYAKATFTGYLHICYGSAMVDSKDEIQATRASVLATDTRMLVRQRRRRLRAQADMGDLTASQTSAVFTLDRDGPMTVSALARAEGMRPQPMGQ